MAAATIGDLLDTCRARRSCGQVALALGAGVSTTHSDAHLVVSYEIDLFRQRLDLFTATERSLADY